MCLFLFCWHFIESMHFQMRCFIGFKPVPWRCDFSKENSEELFWGYIGSICVMWCDCVRTVNTRMIVTTTITINSKEKLAKRCGVTVCMHSGLRPPTLTRYILFNLYANSPKLRAPLGPHQSKISGHFPDFLSTRHKIVWFPANVSFSVYFLKDELSWSLGIEWQDSCICCLPQLIKSN